jgi:pimeloyl-ACP methyl ester carboxylesterase
MKRALMTIGLLLAMAGLAQAQDVTGDWRGTLTIGPAQLRLDLHIARNAEGGLTGTMDSVDQAAKGIVMTAIALDGTTLTFDVDSIRASYSGTVNADGKTIAGTWSQTQPRPLTFTRVVKPAGPPPAPVAPSDIDGAWLGTLDTGAIKLRLAFHIANTADGLTATMDSLDQGVHGMPVTVVTRNGSSLRMEMRQVAGVFEGTIDAARASIAGTWSQGGGTLPLVLNRVKDAAALEVRRPQTPARPYPYREEPVTYDNAAAHVTLAGTLTLPSGPGPFTTVLLISGSGPQDRDETLMGHHPFLVLADALTRHGIAVLRVDDRGVGKSTGSFKDATSADFAADVEAGIAYLRSRPEVNGRKIGLVGHSEGGLIAPMVAARNPAVAFIVLMAGPGVPGDRILVAQSRLIAEASGATHEQAEANAAMLRSILGLVKGEPDNAKVRADLEEQLGGMMPPAQIEAQVETITSPWYRYFISYDPAAALARVTCPVLAIGGSKDLQVPAAENLAAIRAALAKGGNTHVQVEEFAGLNHLFQTATTGAPAEYSQIEETMSPAVLDRVTRWIQEQ